MTLDDETRAALQRADQDPDRIEAALARLVRPPRGVRLDRPATLGDGIVALDDASTAQAEQAFAEGVAAGRVSAFVPASGAATRMAGSLAEAWRTGLRDLETSWGPLDDARRVVRYAEALALWPELAHRGARPHDAESILGAMFGPAGFGLDKRPKGLFPFHRGADAPRTAIAEHVAELRALLGPASVTLHVTVSEAHQELFAQHLAVVAPEVNLTLSTQSSQTDMPCLADGAPALDSEGKLLFRAGGHGALVHNLQQTGADVVLLKNIDNVVPEGSREIVLTWRRRVGGLLLRVQSEAHELVRALRKGERLDDAREFVRSWLGLELSGDHEVFAARLDRPWRVCGMVRNDGQPGGGPFWATSHGEVSLQIIEASQVDSTSGEQRAIVHASTHFNPVDLALGLRNADGEAHDLLSHVDPDASIVTEKVQGGRRLRVIEHPGLWNGSMAGWNSVFVEVPPETFAPVKSISDLLRWAHGGPLG